MVMGGKNGIETGFSLIYDIEKMEIDDNNYGDLIDNLNHTVDMYVGDIELKTYLLV